MSNNVINAADQFRPTPPPTSVNINFTQFIKPAGKEKQVHVAMPLKYGPPAAAVLSSGRYRFECEVLNNGIVSITCADTEKEEDIAIELVENGPNIREAVGKVILAAHQVVIERGHA